MSGRLGKWHYDNKGVIIVLRATRAPGVGSLNPQPYFVTHFTEENSEAQGDSTCPRSHGPLEPDSGLKSPSDFSPVSWILVRAACD